MANLDSAPENSECHGSFTVGHLQKFPDIMVVITTLYVHVLLLGITTLYVHGLLLGITTLYRIAGFICEVLICANYARCCGLAEFNEANAVGS